jgi:hypothetical protein
MCCTFPCSSWLMVMVAFVFMLGVRFVAMSAVNLGVFYRSKKKDYSSLLCLDFREGRPADICSASSSPGAPSHNSKTACGP